MLRILPTPRPHYRAVGTILAASLVLTACASSEPRQTFSQRLVSETATLTFMGDRIERAYKDVKDLWADGWKGGPCVRMSEQGGDIRAGQAIIAGWMKQEAAVKADPNGGAALQQAGRFTDLSEIAARIVTETCTY